MPKLTRNQYIERFWRDAIEACREYPGLFPSILLAQAILESGNGNSQLAARYNNHFGIKADRAWRGRVVNLRTREVVFGKDAFIRDGFRVYDSAEDSFRDRNAFLAKNPRYRKAGVFDSATHVDQARALQAAGYATDPDYADKLISIIHRNNLTQYDNVD